MATLLLAEIHNHRLTEATLKSLTAAHQLGAPIDLLILGEGAEQAAQEAQYLHHLRSVIICTDARYSHGLAEPVSALILSIMAHYSYLVGSSTSFAKNILPRVAAKLGVMQISEVTTIFSPDEFERPIYAGNALQRVRSLDAKKVLTIRTTAFQTTQKGADPVPVKTVLPYEDPCGSRSRFMRAETIQTTRPELTSAKIVVSGGRALQSKEAFEKYIMGLADSLGAAIGASRAAVDSGYAPNDYQVGQTGKVIAPDLYIAVGIAGAIQHVSGIKDARVIVAINKDPEAPIFQVADYGLVQDLFTAVPELQDALRKNLT